MNREEYNIIESMDSIGTPRGTTTVVVDKEKLFYELCDNSIFVNTFIPRKPTFYGIYPERRYDTFHFLNDLEKNTEIYITFEELLKDKELYENWKNCMK